MEKRDRILNILIICLSAALAVLVVSLFVLRGAQQAPEAAPSAPSEADASAALPGEPERGPISAWAQLDRNELSDRRFSSDENGRISYDGARPGVDVSRWQGQIDWPAVEQDGVEFAVIQLGYRGYTGGTISLDERFSENLAGAQAAGLDCGVYFFSQAVSAAEAEQEAEFVLDVLDGTPLALPVFYDWEPVDNENARTYGISSEELTPFAEAFCRRIEEAGYDAGVYFNLRQGYLGYDLTLLEPYCFWLAEYRDTPSFFYAFRLWQYTDSASVDGIEGPVDLNLWFPEK